MKPTVFVSQGSHDSIGIEVFLKSFSCLSLGEKTYFQLVCNEQSLRNHLSALNYDYSILGDKLIFSGGTLRVSLVKKNKTEAQDSLDSVLSQITDQDVLLTLPMNKEELYFDDKLCSGHTEYFRKYFSKANLAMFFKSHRDYVLLLSDHVPLNAVSQSISNQDNYQKISMTLDYLKSNHIEEVILSGLNPHAGENGTLGSEENILIKLISKLQKNYPKLKFSGPFPSDTIYQERRNPKNQLFIFCYHDQGLNIFKERNRFLGLNITIGLPFQRLSVDHGTAPNLVGKNIANYECSLFSLNESLKMLGVL